jgi:predicted metal-dependent hydrolase
MLSGLLRQTANAARSGILRSRARGRASTKRRSRATEAYVPKRKPAGVQVKARRVDFHFDASLPRYWYLDDPFLTHFMQALSITFPEGERMFMDAVRAVRERVQDAETRGDIAGFMGQEALHSRAHDALNEHLARMGYPAARLEQGIRQNIADHRPQHTKQSLLALTCALEHITAIMGHHLLSHPELQEHMHPAIRDLWIWHAVEETEHKAVAFDVYQEVYGDYRIRTKWLLLSTLGLTTSVSVLQYYLLRRDGMAKPAVWLKGLWKLWGPGGLLLPLVPAWLAYFKPGFHPWDIDDSALIERYRQRFDEAELYTKKSGKSALPGTHE